MLSESWSQEPRMEEISGNQSRDQKSKNCWMETDENTETNLNKTLRLQWRREYNW